MTGATLTFAAVLARVCVCARAGRGAVRHLNQINDYLYLGGEESTSDKAFLQEHCGVTHILNCTGECPLHYPDDFQCLRIAVNDDAKESLAPYFHQAHEFIESARAAGGNVLVGAAHLCV